MIELPDTPMHCNPDQAEYLDRINDVDEKEIDDLDLNPELDRNDDSMETGSDNFVGSSNRPYMPDDEASFDDVDDYKPRINFDSPFSSNQKLGHAENLSNTAIPKRRLSHVQQSKFITYLDEQLMHIQRKVIQSRSLNYNRFGYEDLSSLLDDLKVLVDFIWYSIEGASSTDYLLKLDLLDYKEEFEAKNSAVPVDKSAEFGQASYLLRIADELIEFVEKFDITLLQYEEKSSTVVKLIKLLFILDKIFARLMDGTIPGKVKMTKTDAIRFCGIAERTRMQIPLYFENHNVQGYHYELSKIYQEGLERIAI